MHVDTVAEHVERLISAAGSREAPDLIGDLGTMMGECGLGGISGRSRTQQDAGPEELEGAAAVHLSLHKARTDELCLCHLTLVSSVRRGAVRPVRPR